MIVQDEFTNWIQSDPMQTKDTSESMSCLRRFLAPLRRLEHFYTVMTRVHLLAQTRLECQKEPSADKKKGRPSHLSTTERPMVRQHSRKDLVTHLTEHPFPSVHPDIRSRQVKFSSVWCQNIDGNHFRLCAASGRKMVRRRTASGI